MSNTATEKKDIEIKNPFPGLRPFTVEESHLYFGREKQGKTLLKLLHANQFTAVIGPSGSGKSSLVNCVVVPDFLMLSQGNGKVISFKPGSDPLRNMVDAFIRVFPGKIGAMDNVDLLNGEKSLEEWISEHEFRDHNFLLVIDQFEEIFRLHKPADNRDNKAKASRFIDLIVGAVPTSGNKIRIIITVRSDFIGECSIYPELIHLINNSPYFIPQMNRDDFREAIMGPLKLSGVTIEGELLDRMLNEVDRESDQLPVFQHALMRTFNYWRLQNKRNKPLTAGDYEAAGTIRKALSDHADEAFHELSDSQKLICERLFKTITEKGQENIGIRRPATIGKIAGIVQCEVDDVIKVASKFRSEGRTFLTPYEPVKLLPDTIIDISHESMIWLWDRLRLWVDEEVSSVQVYRRLVEASALYQAGRAGLLKSPDLEHALDWKEKQKPNLPWANQYYPAYERSMLYLITSVSERKREEENKLKQQKRRLMMPRLLAGFMSAVAIIAIGLLFWPRDLNIQTQTAAYELTDNREISGQESPEGETLIAEVIQPEETETEQEDTQQEEVVPATSNAIRRQSQPASEQAGVTQEDLNEARRQARIARTTSQEAERLQQIAAEREKAEREQREQAELASRKAYQSRLVSIAKSVAVKLLQVNDDPDLQALLAYQAYKFNAENNGNRYDADIYGGLYQALKSNLSPAYNVYSGHYSSVRSLAWYRGRKGFLSADSEGKILFMSGDFRNSRANSLIANTGRVNVALVISPDETTFACGTDGGGIFVYNMSNTANYYILGDGHEGRIQMLAFHDAGRRLISAGLDNTIMDWDLNSRRGSIFTILSSRPTALAISNSSKQLVIGTMDGRLLEFDLENPGEGRILYNNPGNRIMSVTYSTNDNSVVIGTLNGMVRIINRNNPSTGITISGPEARVTNLLFSNNGKFLAAASHDGNVYLWETSDWNNKPVVVGDNEGFVLTLCFSDDSKYFYSGSTQAPRLIGRPVESSLMAGDFCDLVSRNLTQSEWDNYIGADIPYRETCPK